MTARQPTPDIMAAVLSPTRTVDQLPPDQIRTNGGTQPRAAIDHDLVEEYAEAMLAGAQFPPVTIFHDGADHWLADGFHRHAACIRLGIPVPCDIRQGTRRDAILYSAGANATHGQRRTNTDKRRAVIALLTDGEWSQWSNREIARRCAVSAAFVGNLRSYAVPPTVNGLQSTLRRGADGRTIDTANIGNRPPAPDPAPQAPKYATLTELELAIGDWLEAFDDQWRALDELADPESLTHQDLVVALDLTYRPRDLATAITLFRQRMAAYRNGASQPRPAPAGDATAPAADSDRPLITFEPARGPRFWTFQIVLAAPWNRLVRDQQRTALHQAADRLETQAAQMREEADDL